MPDVASSVLDLPRLAIFSTWGSTQEVGWVRHAFDHFGVTFDLIYKERVRKGSLRRDYDVILVPNQGRARAKSLVFDVEAAPGASPWPTRRPTASRPWATYGESEDITGGMGLEGAAELNRFVAEGGLLITLASSSVFPAEFGLTPRVDASRTSGQFYAPGPIVQTEIQKPEHPVFWGYTEKTMGVRYANGPLLRVPEADKGQTLSKFPGRRRRRALGPDERGRRDQGPPRHPRRPRGQGPGPALRHQPLLQMAEPRRVQHCSSAPSSPGTTSRRPSRRLPRSPDS